MSLINEALKKAQRARLEDQAAAEAIAPGGAVPKRRQARSANTMVLIGAGAVTLIVLSVVATVYFVSGDSKPAPAPTPVAKSTATPSPTAAAAAPTPPASAPASPSPVPAPPSAPAPATAAAIPSAAALPTTTATAAPTPATVPTGTPSVPAVADTSLAGKAATPTTTPAASSARPATPAPVATPVAAIPPAAAPAGAPAAPTLDPRIAAYVDGLRVTGVRASGNDSRVLMNDRVYRVNDMVERNLGVRLVKVAGDSLTFADANGFTYVKHL